MGVNLIWLRDSESEEPKLWQEGGGEIDSRDFNWDLFVGWLRSKERDAVVGKSLDRFQSPVRNFLVQRGVMSDEGYVMASRAWDRSLADGFGPGTGANTLIGRLPAWARRLERWVDENRERGTSITAGEVLDYLLPPERM